jgi:tetratricopeptide (TPR) repeat protein
MHGDTPMTHRLALLATTLIIAGSSLSNAQTVEEVKTKAVAAWSEQNWEQAASLYEKVVKADAKDATAWHRLGYALHALGRLDEALPAHQKSAEFTGSAAATGAYNAACVYALKGQKDEAFSWLDKAVAKGFNNATQLETDTDMDSIRNDPRFKKLVGSMEAAPPAPAQAWISASPRKDCRLFYWAGNGSPGQMVVSYGPVTWKDSYEGQFQAKTMTNRRWRLGSNFWTTLDTNMDITIGGQKVPAGYYYITLEKKDDGNLVLALNDPAQIRARKLDAFQAHETKGGIEIPMAHATSEDVAGELTISFHKGDASGQGNLEIRFGGHSLNAPYTTPIKAPN